MKSYKFGEWLNVWFDVYKKPKLKKSSAVPIECAIRIHVPQILKDTYLSDLTVLDLDRAVSQLNPSRTQKVLYDTLCSALRKAYSHGYIERDLSVLLEPVRFRTKHGVPLSASELRTFFFRIHGHRLCPLYRFYVLTGVRRHEALTLTWSDVDFSSRLIHIRGTKTLASERYLPITDELQQLLDTLPVTGERLFPFNDDYVTKFFKKNCPDHNLHDLRHTFITLCSYNHLPPVVTQRLVGHSKIDTTMRIYTHVSLDFIKKETDNLRFDFLFPGGDE